MAAYQSEIFDSEGRVRGACATKVAQSERHASGRACEASQGTTIMKRVLQCSAFAGMLLCGVVLPCSSAFGQDDTVGLGLAPGAPQITNVAGGITPAYGAPSETDQDWQF